MPTSSGGLRYPASSDPANVPTVMQNLAEDVDTVKAPKANPTFTGVAQFPDGSASAPSITNTGDTNTGIFHPADDTVAISTGGTERVRVNSTGLGIGVSPSTDFDIVRDAQVSSRWRSAVTSNRGSLLYFDKARGSWASPSSVSNSDAVMELYARAHDGTQVRDVAAIVANIDSVPATNDLGARFSFQTRPSGVAASVTERMRIDSNGLITGTGTSLGAWTAYTPSVTSGLGTPTTTTAAARYTVMGKTCTVTFSLTVTNKGTADGGANLTLPFTAASSSRNYIGAGRENGVTSDSMQVVVASGGTSAILLMYDGATPWVNNYVCLTTITYEIA